MRPDDFMGGRAHVDPRAVNDEIFEGRELPLSPQRGAGFMDMHADDLSLGDRARPQSLKARSKGLARRMKSPGSSRAQINVTEEQRPSAR
jgi:hypothetical protein